MSAPSLERLGAMSRATIASPELGAPPAWRPAPEAPGAPLSARTDHPELLFRQLGPQERPALLAHWLALGPESLALRFFYMPKPEFLASRAESLDFQQPRLLGAFTAEGELLSCVEWARELSVDGSREQAECAFSSLPHARGKGLAKALALWAAIDCQAQGIQELAIYHLPENRAAARLSQSLGGVIDRSRSLSMADARCWVVPTGPLAERSARPAPG